MLHMIANQSTASIVDWIWEESLAKNTNLVSNYSYVQSILSRGSTVIDYQFFYLCCLILIGISTTLVNGFELNFGVFRSGWISEILSVCFSSSFWAEFAFVVSFILWKFVCMCSMSEVPPKMEQTSSILLYYNDLKLLKLFLIHSKNSVILSCI